MSDSKKKSLLTWVVVDALLLLAIVVAVVFIVAQIRANNQPAENELTQAPTGVTNPISTAAPTQQTAPTDVPTPTTTVTGWNERENGRQYVDDDGNLLMSTWKTIDDKQYCFDAEGYARTGWYVNETGTFFFASNGEMLTGEQVIEGVEQVFDDYGLWLGTKEEVMATTAPTATPTPTISPTPTEIPVIEDDEYKDYSTKVEGWYFERMSDHAQSGSFGFDTKYKFDEVGAYYLNKDVTDEDKVIYLTFDCGYENGYTPSILDTLKAHNAKATFFVTKPFIRDATDLVIRMKEEGHLVGNHTVTHPNLAKCTTEKVVAELTQCAAYMKEMTGYDFDPFMRPPEGAYSEKSLRITNDLGYKTIFWSIAYLDWDPSNQPGKEYVVNHFSKYYHNGAIPLIHVVSESNCQALDDVLTLLEAAGYRFGSLTELN